MSIGFKRAAAVILFAGFTGVSSADAEDRTVSAGRSTPIDMAAIGSKFNCSTPGKPTMFVSQQPAHGTISFNWTTTKYGPQAPLCVGKPLKGMLIIYTPNKGFHGHDTTTVGARYPTYEGSNTTSAYSTTYNITVK